MENRLDQISQTQRACLRLVAQNLSSKEIAQTTGLSPQTVDQYLSRAAVALGVSNRREAARRFAELEAQSGAETFRQSEFKSPPLAEPQESVTLALPDDQKGAPRTIARFVKWLPPIGGRRHDLDRIGTVYAILKLSLVTMAAATAIIVCVIWLTRLTL